MNRNFLYLIFALMVLVLNFGKIFGAGCVFYVQAHQDDWQLFRGQQAWNDVKEANVVFIYMTAGDAGTTLADNWWPTREKGAMASVGVILGAYPGALPNPETVTVNGHQITCYSWDNTKSYFMRLPDGMRGNGSSTYGSQSLAKLYDAKQYQQQYTVSAVDGSTTYNSWDDLVDTLTMIMQSEAAACPSSSIWVNFSMWDNCECCNSGDHSDHHYTALAVLQAEPGYQKAPYLTYITQNMPSNLSDGNYTNKYNLYFKGYWSVINNAGFTGSANDAITLEWGGTGVDNITGEIWGKKGYFVPSGQACCNGPNCNSPNCTWSVPHLFIGSDILSPVNRHGVAP